MLDHKLFEYNSLDAACTLEAKEKFWPDLADGFLPAYDMTLDIFPVLTFMMTRGIKIDMAALETTRHDIVRQAALKQEELNQLVGRELNVNSTQQCQKYFYVELGIPPYYNDGKVTTDDLALQRLARGTAKRPGLRAAKLVQDIRGLQKLHGTYLDIEFDPDGRMRCSYNPRGNKFGRLSSSKTIFGTGTNNQNLPQEFKCFLVADDGYIFWEIDKRQAEWVVVAYLSGDPNMLAAIEQGKDAHIFTEHLGSGVPEDILRLETKIVGMNTDPNLIEELRLARKELTPFLDRMPRSMSTRQRGKKSNHAFNYDEGPNQWALINGVEIAEGKRAHAMYHSAYPGIRVWHTSIQRQLSKSRTLVNCFGRKYRFMGQWDIDLFKSAYSFLPQSSVVDSLNEGMAKIYEDEGMTAIDQCNIDILAQVHDSVLMQIPIEVIKGPNTFKLLRDRMYDYVSPTLTYNGRTFKIATDSKFGFNWGGYHEESNQFGMNELRSHDDILTLIAEYERTRAG
ncbi:MAG TPA: DNA polymerase [Nitrospiraceae bacterium]